MLVHIGDEQVQRANRGGIIRRSGLHKKRTRITASTFAVNRAGHIHLAVGRINAELACRVDATLGIHQGVGNRVGGGICIHRRGSDANEGVDLRVLRHRVRTQADCHGLHVEGGRRHRELVDIPDLQYKGLEGREAQCVGAAHHHAVLRQELGVQRHTLTQLQRGRSAYRADLEVELLRTTDDVVDEGLTIVRIVCGQRAHIHHTGRVRRRTGQLGD